MQTHRHTDTQQSFLLSQRGAGAVRKDLQGPPVLPAVGWLEGLVVFVKVMGPRWVNSQGTHSVLCHLRNTKLGEGAWGRGGGGGEISSSPALPKNPRSLTLPPPAPPESDYQASREQTSPIWSVCSGSEAGVQGALLHLCGAKRPEQTQLMKS